MTPVRVATIRKTENNKCWQGYGEKGTLMRCWWERNLAQPPWKTVWRFLKKLKIELPYDPKQFHSSIFIQKKMMSAQEGICTPMFITAFFTIDTI